MSRRESCTLIGLNPPGPTLLDVLNWGVSPAKDGKVKFQ
jgi:hypothetical protein